MSEKLIIQGFHKDTYTGLRFITGIIDHGGKRLPPWIKILL